YVRAFNSACATSFPGRLAAHDSAKTAPVWPPIWRWFTSWVNMRPADQRQSSVLPSVTQKSYFWLVGNVSSVDVPPLFTSLIVSRTDCPAFALDGTTVNVTVTLPTLRRSPETLVLDEHAADATSMHRATKATRFIRG